MRFDGKLKSWNDERGFGFIEPLQGGQEIFVHSKSFPPGTGRPAVGLALCFEVELGPQGRKRAKSDALDKSAARHGRWRTPEATLHWLSLACGWPGALLAQQLLRHKSSKHAFVAKYWATVVVNVTVFVTVHSPVASGLLA